MIVIRPPMAPSAAVANNDGGRWTPTAVRYGVHVLPVRIWCVVAVRIQFLFDRSIG
jgi:hypothetical protein